MKRVVWLLTGLCIGCASGDDPATSAATTFAASASASGTPTATAAATTNPSTTSGSTSDAETSAQTGDSGDGTSPTTNTDTDTDVGDTSSETSSGSGAPPSEQPEDGMYSPCGSIVDCIGLTACLTATDTGGQPIDAFCTAGACDSPLAQCDPTPGGTAVPICLPIELAGVMDTLCALDCSQGQECPDGMDCRTLAAGSICS
ncbi:MAG: hypothetical protein KUG77_14530 [Nannocystaceae bacterium]|nr:hypothetical protein [Nannocystaceae bacterium]